MTKQLSEEQIADLFLFCEENDVKYYDVQIELVDHFACSIEQKWKENPMLPYDDALWLIYEEFGASGIRKIKSSKETGVWRKYSFIQWKYLKEYFRLPKVLLTIFFTLVLLLILHYSENDFATSFYLAISFSILLLAYLRFIMPNNKLSLIDNRKFLMFDHLKSTKRYIYIICFAPFSLLLALRVFVSEYVTWGQFKWFGEFALAFSLVLFGIFSIIATIYLPRKIKADFLREFPQFVKA